ncbi:ABC transporter related (plasmid) [Gloeothece citriformis PCC 7424]|uniref:ABC transporter related n=1 Tax=Gloeothece citriformis (strain PCC 7424) TaxID=65393 RepID=B7KM12_GLOC7|nr:polysaccharide ABC transporter ATP-binding protein [Gloeothece citriformis]ACK73834.1 ABC transporter related [Gloeothece citriformis PCC 7424]
MYNPIIKVDNLSKKYVLKHQQEGRNPYKSLREVINNRAQHLSQKLLSPYRKKIDNPTREEFWALNNISFEIKQGECVGIIGRNGAGKSTLLKILSRITEPTKGRALIEGRVASLLEVGTGFHPELTGRENIYLNGAILGMAKVEIKRKFDEIVEFAEVEKFLDTPVKHYSSGMYVRLAFAVAAHLEPEILIVDEVLAVGDSAFQKKCLGKMGDVASKEGRTVLFVSHSMPAIAQLTQRCILLSKGKIQFDGNTHKAVHCYMAGVKDETETAYYQAPVTKKANYLAWVRVHTSEDFGIHNWGEPITFEFAFQISEPKDGLRFSFQILNEIEQAVCIFWFFDSHAPFRREAGLHIMRCKIPKFRLYMGSYTLRTWFSDRSSNTLLENLSNICPFEVSMYSIIREEYEWQRDECTYLEEAVWEIAEKTPLKF